MHSAVHGVERGGGLGLFRITAEQIWIRVFGMIHIHTGDGIGVGLFFGLFFSAPVLTLVCRLLSMHTRTLQSGERSSKLQPWHQQTYIIACLDFSSKNATCLEVFHHPNL